MAKLKNLNWTITCAIMAGLIAGAWLWICPNLPESTATVTVLRSQIEDHTIKNETVSNRWVWLRDGMSLKIYILSDSFLLAQLKDANRTKPEALPRLRKNISIEFTGADSSTYHITVKDPDAGFAQKVAGAILAQIKTEIVDIPRNQIDASMAELEKLAKNGNEQAPAMIERLKLSRALLEAQKDHVVRISKQPTVPGNSNRKTPFVIIAAIILGAFIGLAVNVATRNE